ncbi:MAG: hypothetical protein ACI4KB_10270 [Oscillospiraceae bacterium]|nr:hypothetical protein [Oscillospiraceae bacterium]
MKIFTHTCQMCGTEFQSAGNTAKYCVYCRDKVQLQRNRDYKKKKEIGETKVLGSTQVCPHCGKEYILKSPAQKCCAECQKKISSQIKTVRSSKSLKSVRETNDQINFYVPAGERDRIKAYAKTQNMSVSKLMLAALKEYEKNHPDPVKPASEGEQE